MKNTTNHLTLSRKPDEIINKHIEIELEVYKPLHRDILLSIYDIGRGFATRQSLSEYFNIDLEKLNKKYLSVLHSFDLIYYKNRFTKDSIIGLTQYGESYCRNKIVKTYNVIDSDKVDIVISKSEYLYKLASKYDSVYLSKRFDRDFILYYDIKDFDEGLINISREDFIDKVKSSNKSTGIDINKQLDNHGIYLCDIKGSVITFSIFFLNIESVMNKLASIYNHLSQFIDVRYINVNLVLYFTDEDERAEFNCEDSLLKLSFGFQDNITKKLNGHLTYNDILNNTIITKF